MFRGESEELEELLKVKKDAEERNERELIEECDVGIKNIEISKSYLETEGVFSIEVYEFDDEKKDNDCYFDSVAASFEDVKEFIKKDLEMSETKDTDPRWYSIIKWVKNAEGKYTEACTYLIARDEKRGAELCDKVRFESLTDEELMRF